MDSVLKILLVDDDEVDRTMARRALAASGMAAEFSEASDGRAALAALKAGAFDCVLLDRRLPDAEGLDVLREIRRAGIATPVIMLAGEGDEHLAVEMMKAGASDYLSKTRLSRDLLSHSVRHAIGLHRARAEAELARAMARETEERFRRMADSAPVLLWVTDEQGNCTYLNQAWLTFTGRTLDESLGRGWQRDVNPEDLPRVMDDCMAAHGRQEPFEVDYRIRRADGAWRWVSSSAAPRRLADGTFAGFVGTCIDLTDRKRAEAERAELLAREQSARAAAEASERHYRFLAECMPQMVFTATPDGACDYYNARWREYTGHWPASDTSGSWAPTVHPADSPAAERRWADSIRTGRAYEIEYRLRRHDGVYRWHLTRAEPLRDEDGGIVKWFGTCTDIEEQRRNADALHFLAEASELLSSSLDYETTLASLAKLAVPRIADWCAVDMLDDDGAPRRLALVHGDPEKLRLADELRRLYPPDENDVVNRVIGTGNSELFAELNDAMVDGGARDARHAALLRSLGLRSALVVPLPGREGTIGAVTLVSAESGHQFGLRELALAEDLARRAGSAVDNARLYRELTEAKDAAEGANRAKDQFLAVLSHELRTPLTPVLSTVQAMESDPDLPEEFRGSVDMIHRNVELEARLIDDLLDLTRVAKGKLELHPQTIDAHSMLQSALEICYDELRGKGLQLAVHLEAAAHHVRADSARLQQVFWNLVKNAIKFTPEGGRITVSTANEPAAGTLRVEFRDTGIGIDPQVLPDIFNAFEQGERSITRRFGGLGLGLAISKALMDMQGGTLIADSAGRDKGAIFVVELPTVSAPLPAPHLPVPHEASDRPGLRILLVDDHEDTARAMRRLLERSGYDITLAFNVRDALGEFGRREFDLLISDIGLPDGSGLELMRQVRQQRKVRGIALSGFGMEEDIRKSREAGFDEHLIKPINFQKLQAVIRDVAGQSEP
jgi:PAS domain S-box-containing protein